MEELLLGIDRLARAAHDRRAADCEWPSDAHTHSISLHLQRRKEAALKWIVILIISPAAAAERDDKGSAAAAAAISSFSFGVCALGQSENEVDRKASVWLMKCVCSVSIDGCIRLAADSSLFSVQFPTPAGNRPLLYLLSCESKMENDSNVIAEMTSFFLFNHVHQWWNLNQLVESDSLCASLNETHRIAIYIYIKHLYIFVEILIFLTL